MVRFKQKQVEDIEDRVISLIDNNGDGNILTQQSSIPGGIPYDGYITLTQTGVEIGLGTELLKTTDGYIIINDSSGNILLTMDNLLKTEKQILINNSVPLANPPKGMGYLYSDSGAGKWRSPSGTITTFGTADPHCPKCGRDFALEYENNGEVLSICMSCFADVFGSFIIRDTRRK